jgi:hypothetical protein
MNRQGNSSLLMYDPCATRQYVTQTRSPYDHVTDINKYEHNRMKSNVPHPQTLTPAESELKGITRPASKCDSFKYNPQCPKSKMCTSTFDRSNKKVLAPELFPIVHNNLVPFR